MSLDQTVLRLRIEGRERFAVRYDSIRDEWEVLSAPDISRISDYFEQQKVNLRTVGQAYDVILNYAKNVFNFSDCELEIIQTGELRASDKKYNL